MAERQKRAHLPFGARYNRKGEAEISAFGALFGGDQKMIQLRVQQAQLRFGIGQQRKGLRNVGKAMSERRKSLSKH